MRFSPRLAATPLLLAVFGIPSGGSLSGAPTPDAQQARPADSPATLVAQGSAEIQRGEFQAAKESFERALRLDPKSFTALTYLGILADREGNLAEAEGRFAAAVATAPSSPEARNNHGAILLKLGNKFQALKEFEASLRLNPKQPGALVNLAQIHFGNGTPDELRAAQTLFDRAWRLAPDAEIARALVVIPLRLHEPVAAARAFPKYSGLLATAPESVSSAKARGELCTALFEAGLFQESAQELQAAVQAEPDDPKTIALLARAHREEKDYRAAEETLRSAIARKLESAGIYSELAEVCDATGRIEDAIPAMHRAVQLDSGSQAYRFRYAMLLIDAKAPEAAVMRLQEAVKDFPVSPGLWFAMGLAQYSDGKFEKAATAFSHALELDPKMAPALTYLGIIAVDEGKDAEAVSHYEKALAADERSSVTHYLLSEALAKLSPPDDAGAEAHLKLALMLDTGFAEARLALGKLYLRTNRLDKAAQELEEIVKMDPNLVQTYFQLSRVYTRQKRTQEAKAMADKFEELSKAQKQQSENERRDILRRLANVRF